MRVTQGAPGETRPWRLSLAWLAFLGPFFFASYGFANWSAAQRASVPSVVFGWEHAIPFLPWTIVPYWSIDLFYAASLFLCATRAELRTLVHRLLFVQIAAVLCFLAAPLRFSFERPPTTGAYGALFDMLSAFDLPFNQAPSLHVALLVVLWPFYLQALPARWRPVVHAVALAIGVSVLTTWQHHFVDVPTGVWLGCLSVWLVRPDRHADIWRIGRWRDPARRGLAIRYGACSAALASIAAAGQGGWLWLAWPAATLALVAAVQLFGDGRAYGKQACGRFDSAAWVLFAPYFFGAWINARLWTRAVTDTHEVCEGVRLGSLVRVPGRDVHGELAIVDVSGEIHRAADPVRDCCIPMLDLVPPSVAELQAAALAIDAARARGTVLVACALGFSRSAVSAAAWLMHAGRADSADAAIEVVRRARPAVVLGPGHAAALEAWQHLHAPGSSRTATAPAGTIAANAHPQAPAASNA